VSVAAATVRVRVNGEERELPEGATVARLLQELGIGTPRVAVERNREIVPKATYAETRLEAGDALEVVELVGGG
jgi:thiamine biosynthesis protein ThiS